MVEKTIGKNLASFIKPGLVSLFSKTWCPYCAQTKDTLNSYGVKFQAYEMDIEKTFTESNLEQELKDTSGMKSVPQIFVGNKFVGGNSELNKLVKSSDLFLLLKEEGVRFTDDDAFD